MSKQYEFYGDGMVKKETDALNPKFDRLSRYDFSARLTETRTGAEARGQTDSPVNIPYRNSYQYDAFGNQTQDLFKHFTIGGVYNLTYQNNRLIANGGIPPFYDAEGNVTTGETSVPGKDWIYDASGKLSSTYLQICGTPCTTDQEFFTYDGDGLLVKRKNSDQDNDDPPVVESEYQLRSSVLKGEVITELDTSGSKRRTFIRANGTVLATNAAYGNIWMHKDPALSSLRSTDSSGNIIDGNAYGTDYDRLELDPTGKSVGFIDPYNYGATFIINTDLLPITDSYDQMVNGQRTTFTVDGMRVPRDYAIQALETGYGSNLSYFEQQARRSRFLGVAVEARDGNYRTIIVGGPEDEGSFGDIARGNGSTLHRFFLGGENWAGNLSLFPFSQQQKQQQTNSSDVNKAVAIGFTDSQFKQIKDQADFMASNAACRKAFLDAGLMSVYGMIMKGGLTFVHNKLLEDEKNNAKWGGFENLRTQAPEQWARTPLAGDVTPIGSQRGRYEMVKYFRTQNSRSFV